MHSSTESAHHGHSVQQASALSVLYLFCPWLSGWLTE
jgi:hypothetical protein